MKTINRLLPDGVEATSWASGPSDPDAMMVGEGRTTGVAGCATEAGGTAAGAGGVTSGAGAGVDAAAGADTSSTDGEEGGSAEEIHDKTLIIIIINISQETHHGTPLDGPAPSPCCRRLQAGLCSLTPPPEWCLLSWGPWLSWGAMLRRLSWGALSWGSLSWRSLLCLEGLQKYNNDFELMTPPEETITFNTYNVPAIQRLRPVGHGAPDTLGYPVVDAEMSEPRRGPRRGTTHAAAAAAVAPGGRSVQRLARRQRRRRRPC